MADPATDPKSTLDVLFTEHLTAPAGEDGIGSTLGPNVSAERQRQTDLRNHATDLPDAPETDDGLDK